jgi:hypothetical protein
MVSQVNKQLIEPTDLAQARIRLQKGSALKSATRYGVESWSTQPKAQIHCSL